MDYEVEVRGLEELAKRFAEFDKIAGAEVGTAMGSAVEAVAREARALAPHNSRFLISRITGVVKNKGGPVKTISGVVGAHTPYARVMEFGASPFWPNRAQLQYWVESKFGLKGAEAERVAFFVARAISRYGLKPRLYMQEGLKKARPEVLQAFEQAVQRIAKQLAV